MENKLSNPQPQGRKAPRCCKLQWEINIPALNRKVSKLPDAKISNKKQVFLTKLLFRLMFYMKVIGILLFVRDILKSTPAAMLWPRP